MANISYPLHSRLIPLNSSQTPISPTTADCKGPALTQGLSRIPRRSDAKETRSNEYARRHPSSSDLWQPQVFLNWIADHVFLASKLIDVSQSNHPDEASKTGTEYARLFSERFCAPQQNSRPSSSDSHSIDTAQSAWLLKAVGDKCSDEQTWNRVIPIKSGELTLQFDDVLNVDRRSGQGGR